MFRSAHQCTGSFIVVGLGAYYPYLRSGGGYRPAFGLYDACGVTIEVLHVRNSHRRAGCLEHGFGCKALLRCRAVRAYVEGVCRSLKQAAQRYRVGADGRSSTPVRSLVCGQADILVLRCITGPGDGSAGRSQVADRQAVGSFARSVTCQRDAMYFIQVDLIRFAHLVECHEDALTNVCTQVHVKYLPFALRQMTFCSGGCRIRSYLGKRSSICSGR